MGFSGSTSSTCLKKAKSGVGTYNIPVDDEAKPAVLFGSFCITSLVVLLFQIYLLDTLVLTNFERRIGEV